MRSSLHPTVSFPPSPTARDFQIYAQVLGMEYEVPGVEAKGQSASTFRSSKRTLPVFPSAIPVTQRDTFWRWTPEEGTADLIIASQMDIFNSLMFVASGRSDSAEGISLEDTQSLYDALRNLLVDVCLKGATFNHPSDDPPHEFIER